MDPTFSRTLSAWIAARAALGWTQEALAGHCNMSLIAISRIEGGKATPRKSTTAAIASALAGQGVRIVDDQPRGGFTIQVPGRALRSFFPPGRAPNADDARAPIGEIAAIVAARHVLDWTQPALAEQANIALNTIAKMEAGLSTPSRTTLDGLQRAIKAEGIKIVVGAPSDGFTIEVKATAIRNVRPRPILPQQRKRTTGSAN
jgi:transcriptional regulator with XRE-family HTH domain